MKFRIIFLMFLSVLTLNGYAQKNGKNIPNFEHRKFHFGTHLGGTSTNYRYELKTNFGEFDSVSQISILSRPGFAIHLPLISWNIHSTFHVVGIPSLSFHETEFNYTYLRKGKKKAKVTRTEPTMLNFPILLKFNTKRLNNFSAYAVGGFSYSYDLASQDDVEQKISDPIVKLKKHDYAYHVGGGFDFYLPYFKFGLEIKVSNGINDLLIQDETFFAAPLKSLKSQTWWFSITLEG